LRPYIAIILLIALSGPMMIKTGLIVNYWANYNYYKEVLCENKDNPMKNCNGQCAISKQLRAAEAAKDRAESNLPILSKIEVSYFILSAQTEHSFGHSPEACEPASHLASMHSEIALRGIFHPPLFG